MKEKINLPSFLLEHLPWENEVNPIWLASTFILRRNLSKYNFPPKMDGKQFEQTFNLLQNCLLKNPSLVHSICLKAEEVSPLDKEFFFEHFLCMEGFQNTLSGQGFIIDPSSKFMAMLNISDHLQLQLVDCTGKWEKIWNTLNELENTISATLDFAFNSKFGYLASNPAYSGTGLTILIYLHLPALIHTKQLEEILLKERAEDVTPSGMQGPMDELIGDLLVLRNTYTLGVNEENILHSLHSSAMKLMACEKTLRTHLKTQDHGEMKDLVSRSYGLLMHSYQIQTKEALGALSMMKLGLDLGWIEGITDQKLNEAFFLCRKSHLLHTLQNLTLSAEEILHKRAEFLHQRMQGITLKI